MELSPTIEADGSLGEIEHDGVSEFYTRMKEIDTPSSGPAMGPTILEQKYFQEVLQRQIMAFKLADGRRAMLKVFVSQRFMPGLKSKERLKAIQAHANSNAPWLFTYGKRVKDGK